MSDITGPTGLIFRDETPDHLRKADHYVYTENGISYLRSRTNATFATYMTNRAMPGALTTDGFGLVLTDLDFSMGGDLFGNNAGREARLAAQGINSSGFRTRGTIASRVRRVQPHEFPKGWLKPAFDPKKATPKQLRKALKRAQQAHEKDVQTIGREFLAEANTRGLCAEYDTVIQRINGGLAVKMPVRQRFVVKGEVTTSQEVAITLASDATDEEIIAAAQARRSDLANPVVTR